MAKKKTKKEELLSAVAEAVGAGRELHLESVDFSDPNRPKTCLEVDFPILPINALAAVESASGAARKPIYLATKWWARRQPSVFRSMLLAAATKSPNDPAEAAKKVWGAYYGVHDGNADFHRITVADIFMGGGVTLVEGLRLGFQMTGVDLNPVAWFTVKNELSDVTSEELEDLLETLETTLKPHIIPFSACVCPRGHKGKWTKRSTSEVMDQSFDPLSLMPEERPDYDYEGPEVVYTFWAKHGPCQATECNHRTPIMTSPIIAVKKLTVKAWPSRECSKCGDMFDIEQKDARMAPAALFVVAENERTYTVMDDEGRYQCPHCHHWFQDEKAAVDGKSASLGKSENKAISLTLLVHPEWLRGTPGLDASGNWYGGRVTDDTISTARWNAIRETTLQLIEVRGSLPDQIVCPDTGKGFFTDTRGGTVPAKAAFTCMEPTCGKDQDVLTAVKQSGASGPVSMYAIHGYCPKCHEEQRPYSGRFFALPDVRLFDVAFEEWERRKEADLRGCWPTSELPYAFMTHHNNGGIPNHGFTHWWTMFNPRQLLFHSQFLKFVRSKSDSPAAELVLGMMPQVLRANCSFSFWNKQQDCLEPALGAANFHPKTTTVENCVFTSNIGRGNFRSYAETLLEAVQYQRNPWDLVSLQPLRQELGISDGPKTLKLPNTDVVDGRHRIECCSATDLSMLATESVDVVITDPPFGGLMHYSELSDFFYVWLRLALKDKYPDLFSSEFTPKALEAVTNRARHPDDPEAFYQKTLTACWKEAGRILKPGGILAFTFHHSEDEPWVAVLESLFHSGFYLEAAYPIRSDDTKGEGAKPGTFVHS